MELPQRHREHGVRIRKEEINHRNSGIRNIFKSELRALCVSVVIPFPSVSSLPSAFSLLARRRNDFPDWVLNRPAAPDTNRAAIHRAPEIG
jgi:hypothetical protein